MIQRIRDWMESMDHQKRNHAAEEDEKRMAKAVQYFQDRTEDIIIHSEHEKDRDEWNRYHYALQMVEKYNKKGVEVFTCLFQDEKHPLEDFKDYENRYKVFRLEKMKERINWAATKDVEGYYEWGRDLACLFKELQKEQNARDFANKSVPQRSRT